MGKKKETKKTNKSKKMKFSKRHPKLSLAIKLIVLLIIMLIVVGAGAVVGMLYGAWGQDFEITEEELVLSGNSVILDSDGKVLAELSGDENRKVITLDEMSPYLTKAYIAIEDERFETHSGVDFKRTGGAILTYITHAGSSSYGGSTITQQLVKNITKDDEDTGIEGVTRKVKEWAKAYQIERMLSKNQILELYLNIIFVGSSNYGVEVGSEYYFNKSAKDLSLVECAFLAGINNAPNAYNPYSETSKYGKDEAKTQKVNNRTKTVLNKMLELGYINQEEYDKAVAKVDKGIKFKKGTQTGSVYSYHTDATIAQVISDIAEEKGWSKEYATTYVYGGGLTIYSTQETDVQEKMEKVMADDASTYQFTSQKTKDSNGEYVKSQAATAIIDNENGYVVGVVGELGEKTTSRGLNRATQSTRSTGSSIKPLADILPGIEEGIITASTRYNDVYTDFGNNFKPKNQGIFRGEISLREATARSQNIPFVKVMAELTTPVSTTYLKKMGITTLDAENDIGLSLAIGGLYKGISPLEMAGAYAAIANNGEYRTPLFYTKVVDSDGKTVFEPKQQKTKICSEQTAYVVKDLLTSVVSGTGATAPYARISGIDVAAKTGTTNDDKDRWLCSFTNYYSGATWYGFDQEEEVPKSKGNPAGKILSAIMKSLHSDKKSSRFDKPDGIVTLKVCSKTGLKATSKCKSTYSEIFVKGKEPEECDEASSAVEVCEDTNKLATEYCPNVKTEYSSYVLPKERLNLWKTLGSSGKKAPTEKCTEHTKENQTTSESKPKITLIGKLKITLNVGDAYTEEGAKATDKTDGDITSKIKISGSVNTSKAGTYTVTYTVTNSNEKTTTKTRTIVVKEKTSTNTNTIPNNTTANETTNSTVTNSTATNTTNTTKPNTTNTTNNTKTPSTTTTDDEEDD